MKLKEFVEFLSSMDRKAKGSQILLRIINFLTFMKADYNKLKVKLNDILWLELSKEKTDLKGWGFFNKQVTKGTVTNSSHKNKSWKTSKDISVIVQRAF